MDLVDEHTARDPEGVLLPIHGEPSTQFLMPTCRNRSSPLSGFISVAIWVLEIS
jgi:hypothetical protein